MKYIIFDIDGTLANTKEVDDNCFIKAFQETFDLDISDEKWELIKHVTDWGITEEIVIRELGRNPLQSEYETMIANMVKNLQEEQARDPSQFAEVRGATAFFSNLREIGDVKLGVATGAWEKSALLKLYSIDLDINSICFSNSNYYKTREAITKGVIKQLDNLSDKKPEQIIYFGDGLWDYKTCLNLGISFVGIDVDGNNKLKNAGAKIVFNDYTDSQQILKSLGV